MDQILARAVFLPRLSTTLLALFALAALLLAALGIYGVLSYGVARRTSEIAIRIALGAQPRRVITMILGETALVVARRAPFATHTPGSTLMIVRS